MPVEPEAPPPLINLEAEQSLLGAVLFDNDTFYEVADAVQGLDFHEPFHQRLFEEIGATMRAGRVAEPTILVEAFRDDQAFADFGGVSYLIDLMERAPPSRNAPGYAAVIADLAMRRQMIAAATEALSLAHDMSETALERVMAAEKLMGDVSATGSAKSAFEDIGTLARRQMQRSREMKGRPPGIPIGIHDYDKLVGGLRPKTVNVFGGRPGMGKSAAAIEMALNIARPSIERAEGLGVIFFSLEMPEEQVSTRFACALAYDRDLPPDANGKSQNPTYEDYEKGELTEAQWARLEEATEQLATLPIEIDFRAGLKVSQMLTAVRRQKRAWAARGIKPGVIIIDHILKVAPEKRINDKVQEVGQISGDILEMAKAVDMPVLLLAQLGREVDKREDKRPIMADLKWSGSLEEDAATVTFFYRPEYYNKEPELDADEKTFAKYHDARRRWANRIVFLLEKNRGGRSNISFEMFCDIGSNVIRNLATIDTTAVFDFSESRVGQSKAPKYDPRPAPVEEDSDYEFPPHDDVDLDEPG